VSTKVSNFRIPILLTTTNVFITSLRYTGIGSVGRVSLAVRKGQVKEKAKVNAKFLLDSQIDDN
jgi:hypothetical protein